MQKQFIIPLEILMIMDMSVSSIGEFDVEPLAQIDRFL